MQTPNTIEACRKYIDAKFGTSSDALRKSSPSIVISREAGARGTAIAEKLAQHLKGEDKNDEQPWTVFDHNLVETILNDHHLPKNIAAFMPEDSVGEISSVIGEILKLHPSSWTLLQYTTDTILKLAQTGHAIIVGRGGNLITKHLKNVLSVRLIGSLKKRQEHLENKFDLEPKVALELAQNKDKARKNYVKKNFSIDIDDPVHYDIVINTDSFDDDTIIQIISGALKK